jgi:hypothetical protein
MTKKRTRRKTSKKLPKLRGQSRKLAGKFIAEETRAGYPRKQAIAIGISRARAAEKKSKIHAIADKYL